MRMSWITPVALALVAGTALAEEPTKKGPPFADAKPEAAAGPKPDRRTWGVAQETENGKFSFNVDMKPGIPDPEQVTEIMINANQHPKRPDPVYGSNVPLEGARIVVEVTNPAGQLVGRYLTHAMPLTKGRFGMHFTPTQEGIYTLKITGKTAKGEALNSELKLPVKVWPLPPELQGSGTASGGRRGPVTGN